MNLIKKTLGIAAGVALLFGHAYALDWAVGLDAEKATTIPEEARPYYERAMENIDRINYDGGVVLLAEAAERAPDHVELQFFTEARARNRAEMYYSAASYSPAKENMDYSSPPWKTSEVFYEIADAALRRLLENPDLTAEGKRRLQKEVAIVEAGRDELAQRDQARFETAAPIVKSIFKARVVEMGLAELSAEQTGMSFEIDEEEDEMAPQMEEEEGLEFAEANPFELLPGQHVKNFLPPPPQPQEGQRQEGGQFGFGGQQGGAPPGEFQEFAPQGGDNQQGGGQQGGGGDAPAEGLPPQGPPI